MNNTGLCLIKFNFIVYVIFSNTLFKIQFCGCPRMLAWIWANLLYQNEISPIPRKHVYY